MKRTLATLAVAIVTLIGSQAWAVDAQQTGPWSDTATWGGTVPGPGDSVTVSNAYTVTLDGGVNREISNLNVQNNGALARSGSETLLMLGQAWIQGGSSLTLIAGDAFNQIYVYSDGGWGTSTVTTSASDNVGTYAWVREYGALNLGADLNLGNVGPGQFGGSMNVGGAAGGQAGVVNMNGHNISVNGNLNLGDNGAGVITRTVGTETVQVTGQMWVQQGSNLNLVAGDAINQVYVYSDAGNGTSTVKTATSDNIGTYAWVREYGVLDMQADLNVGNVGPGQFGGSMNVGGAAGGQAGVVKTNGHNISVNGNLNLGDNGAGIIQRTGAESIQVTGQMWVQQGSSLALAAGDTINQVYVYSDSGNGTSTVTTASSGNVGTYAWVREYGVLNLGADLIVSVPNLYGGNVTVGGANSGQQGVINTNGHGITADRIQLSENGGGKINAIGGEVLTTTNLSLNEQDALVKVTQGTNSLLGLTLIGMENNPLGSTLEINGTNAKIELVFDAGSASGIDYGFRWFGDHVSALEQFATDGKLTWSGTSEAVSIWLETDGYTYVGYVGTGSDRHPGDANGDSVVDLQDFGSLKDNFGLTTGATWAQGDFNGDGAIDLQDFGILKDHFGHTTGDTPVTAVPEPATLSLLALSALALRRRKR